MPDQLLIKDLKERIANKQAIIFVGTGVSISSTNNNPIASWQGLLRDGVERCQQLIPDLPNRWKERVLEDIESTDTLDLLSAAEKIETKLRETGNYTRWLRETVGKLTVANPSIISAIKELGLPIITTNYDHLLEEIIGLREMTWKDRQNIARFFQGDEKKIFHLHGHWEHEDSVILGIRNYQNIINDNMTQLFINALQLGKSLIFIGFGAGVEDPNFKKFLDYGKTTLFQTEHHHYRLAKQDQVESARKQHLNSKVHVLSYGTNYSDLAPFLQSLLNP